MGSGDEGGWDERLFRDRSVELGQERKGVRVVSSDHDPVGIEDIGYGRALAKELGIAGYAECASGRGVALGLAEALEEHAGNVPAGTDREGGFVDHDVPLFRA